MAQQVQRPTANKDSSISILTDGVSEGPDSDATVGGRRMTAEEVVHYSEQQTGGKGMHWLLKDAFAILIGITAVSMMIWIAAYLV
jgi:hypothetical protein